MKFIPTKKLRTEGTTNLTQDINNYWYRKFAFPTILKDTMEFWISNNHNNITSYLNGGIGITNNLTSSYTNAAKDNSNLRPMGNYQLFKDYILIININRSTAYDVQLFNQTKSLVYYNNNSVICTDLINCNSQINFTIPTLNYTYVLDNFNLTEGVIRQFSPVSISGSSTSKTITSTLTQGINASVIATTNDCNTLNRIVYTPASSSPTTWTGDSARSVCSLLTTSGQLLSIDSGNNQLVFNYGSPGSFATDILKVLMGFIALIVLIISGGILMFHAKSNFDDLTTERTFLYGIGLLVIVILAGVLINFIAAQL